MSHEQKIKAKLKIVLKANDIDIAESSDPILWQRVLAAISTPKESTTGVNLGDISQNDTSDLSPPMGALAKLAKEIGVTIDILKGSCGPTDSAPFIHLDKHHWEAMKKATPGRGSKAISPIALGSTLLILWKEQAELGNSTIKEAQKVLGTVGITDAHPDRSLNNCEWLQMRGKNIIINPAQTSKAIELAKAYCTKEWTK